MLNRTLTWFRENEINWGIFGFIAGYHLVALVLVPLYLVFGSPSMALWLVAFAMLVATLMSITMGYHRLFSHRTFEAAPVIEWLLAFFGSLSLQGSIIRWSFDHRLHHKHVDKEGDPYGTQLGFWHSHILWLFKKGAPIRESLVRDLYKSKLIRHQHEHYLLWALGSNVIVTVAAGLLLGDMLGALALVFLLRTFVGHHCTWFINSIAHIWGTRPYSTEHSAVNNFVIALLTYGEGYHNYHHTFAGDYRNGIKWYHFDPSKHAIWLLSKVGLTWNLKRVNDLTIKKRLVAADRNLLLEHLREVAEVTVEQMAARGHERIALMRQRGAEHMELLRESGHQQFERMQERVESASRHLVARANETRAAVDAYRAARQNKASRQERKALKVRVRELRAELQEDWRSWQRLCNDVLQVQPALA